MEDLLDLRQAVRALLVVLATGSTIAVDERMVPSQARIGFCRCGKALAEELAGSTVWRSVIDRPPVPHNIADPNIHRGYATARDKNQLVCTECASSRVM